MRAGRGHERHVPVDLEVLDHGEVLGSYRPVEVDEVFKVVNLEGICRVDEGMCFLVDGAAGSEDLNVEVIGSVVAEGERH